MRGLAAMVPQWFLAVVLAFCVRVTFRVGGFFDPRRQQLQIKEIDSLDGRRGHRLHVTRMLTEANAKKAGIDRALRPLWRDIATRCPYGKHKNDLQPV